ncbi:MAG: hypothetical protein AAB116_08050, partial [Candidatus Poribacteria bacterium]
MEQKVSVKSSKDLPLKKEPSVLPVKKDKSLGTPSNVMKNDKADFETQISELEAKPDVNSKEKLTENTSTASSLSPIQQQKLREIEDTITKYVAEYHEVIEAIKITDGITKPSEIHLLWDRMDSIVENVGSLASEYNAIVPGSLFDPNSKIRQLTKGVLEVGNVVIYDSSNSQDKGN